MGQVLKQIQTSDDELRRVQANIADVLNSIQTGPFFGGVTLSGQALASGNNTIVHKLGRTPQLWLVFDKTGGASSLYRVSWSQSNIVINSSAACTVTLWVN